MKEFLWKYIYVLSLLPPIVCKENILFCCVIFRKYFFRVKGNIKFIGIEKLLITVHQSNLHKFRLVSKDTYLLPRKWKILLLLLVFSWNEIFFMEIEPFSILFKSNTKNSFPLFFCCKDTNLFSKDFPSSPSLPFSSSRSLFWHCFLDDKRNIKKFRLSFRKKPLFLACFLPLLP